MLVILRTLCSFVSGSGRLFYKRLISFVLRQITFNISLESKIHEVKMSWYKCAVSPVC